MGDPAVINMFTPQSSAGYYATNNQFQCNGPKGFIEFKLLENNELYVRVDLPGVVGESLRYWTDGDKKQVFFEGEGPKESEHDKSSRSYQGSTGVNCDCHDSRDLTTITNDTSGTMITTAALVMLRFFGPFTFKEHLLLVTISPVTQTLANNTRMILHKVKIKEDGQSCKKMPHSFSGGAESSDGSGRVLQDHPYVIKGPKEAFEAKVMEDGCVYARVDLPGVAKGDASAWFQDGEVRFFGRAQRVMEHEETGRVYLGSFAHSHGNVGKVQFQMMKNGILRIIIAGVPVVC